MRPAIPVIPVIPPPARGVLAETPDVPNSLKGDPGPPGPQGEPGPIGPQGPPGEMGSTGGTGPMGPQGTPGDPGLTGPAGPTGPQGDPGVAGSDGAQGIQGPVGPTGPQGATGTGVTMKGSVASSSNLPPTGNVQGDAYIVQADDSLWIWDGSAWVSGGSIQGPPGATGPQGAQGPTGAQGAAGTPGAPGPQGDPGATGPKGDPGATGAPGPPGADSTVPGPQGPKGDPGAQGPTGATGAPGAPGATGSQGPKGDKGDPGAQGIQGVQGVPGQGVPVGGTATQVLSKIDATNYNTQWVTPASGGLTLPLTQNLTFSPDGAYDIGATASTLRPRNLNLTSTAYAPIVEGNTIQTPLAGTADLVVNIKTDNKLNILTNGIQRWQVLGAGHWVAATDNLYDIGASGASRPRSVYAATSFIGPGAAPAGGTTGQVLAKTSATNYAYAWADPSGGGLTQAQADARYLQLTGGTVSGMVDAASTVRVTGGQPPVPASGKGLELLFQAATNTAHVQVYDRSGSAFLPLTLSSSFVDVASGMRIYGGSVASTGSGLELMYDGTNGAQVHVYDRSGAAYKNLTLVGASVVLAPNGPGGVVTVGGSGHMNVSGNCSANQIISNATMYAKGQITMGPSSDLGILNNGGMFQINTNTLCWYGDVFLDRSAANSLRTRGTFNAAGHIASENGYIYWGSNVIYWDSVNFLYRVQPGGGHHFQATNGAYMATYASAFSPASAAKFKTNIRPLEDSLAFVRDEALHAVRYDERETGKPQIGFVADDWQARAPEVVALDAAGEPLALDYDRIGAITFEALKEFVRATEARLAALERSIT